MTTRMKAKLNRSSAGKLSYAWLSEAVWLTECSRYLMDSVADRFRAIDELNDLLNQWARGNGRAEMRRAS